MKINRLYIKYFLVVMAIVLASQILVMGLFRYISTVSMHRDLVEYFGGIAYVLRDTVGEKLKADDADYAKLNEFIDRISMSYRSRIWIADEQGAVVAQGMKGRHRRHDEGIRTFEHGRRMDPDSKKRVPPFPADMEIRKDFAISIHPQKEPFVYIKIPVEKDGRKWVIYAIHERPRSFLTDIHFLSGLVVVTILVALILFPLTRKITIPLRKLTDSADAVARGEFDRTVDESGSDEIGELARAFNAMTEKVLQMIQGTKELTANISHQIRSPLARMSIASEILRDKITKGDSAEAAKSLLTIEREIGDLDRLTGRIIELIRAETAHNPVEIEKIDLAQEGRNASLRYDEMMKKKGLSFLNTGTEDPAFISGVRRDIVELFDILFDNAIKYCPSEGAIQLTVSSEANRVKLSLFNATDKGVQIHTDEIFKPFVRKESERIPGYGLGLAIADRIAANHRGKITAEQTDSGIIFIIDFPSVRVHT